MTECQLILLIPGGGVDVKRLHTSRLESLGPVRLYLEDVREIESMFPTGEASVETDEYECTSVEELIRDEVKSVQRLRLKTHVPDVVLEIDSKNAMLYRGSDSPAAVRLFNGLLGVLIRRRLWWRRITDSIYLPLIMLLVYYVVAAVGKELARLGISAKSINLGLVVWFGILIGVFVMQGVTARQHPVCLYPASRRASRLWHNAKIAMWDLLLVLLGAFLGRLIR